jgi:hypothetical protein
MSRLRLLFLFGMLAVTASCQTAGAPAPPELPDQACVFPPGRYNFVEYSTPVFRQGAVVGVRPKRDNMPGGYLDIPLRCTSGWSVTGPARLGADRTTLTIAEDAAPGAEIVLRFRVADEPVMARLVVVARDALVLTGTRGQAAAVGCEALGPVRELEFGTDRFAVTFQPFETYKDYWGTYRFDPATGALVMSVEGGNHVPPGLDLEGVARMEGGHLILDQMFLGDPNGGRPAGACRYTF